MKRALPIFRQAPPPPQPGDVLYVPPTGTKEGRRCGNCALWGPGANRCGIFESSQRITTTMVCSYHVFGEPDDVVVRALQRTVRQTVLPALAGLLEVGPQGTRCGNCRWFRSLADSATGGLCMGVASSVQSGSWSPAEVDAWGCCSRWTGASRPVR